eukprot:759361-Hanusia_phi.AAC.1
MGHAARAQGGRGGSGKSRRDWGGARRGGRQLLLLERRQDKGKMTSLRTQTSGISQSTTASVERTERTQVTLRLAPRHRVKWSEDVLDNEGMGKRKSNKCCIFHRKKKFGESSSESEYGLLKKVVSLPRADDSRFCAGSNRKCTCGSDGDEEEKNAASSRYVTVGSWVLNLTLHSARARRPVDRRTRLIR